MRPFALTVGVLLFGARALAQPTLSAPIEVSADVAPTPIAFQHTEAAALCGTDTCLAVWAEYYSGTTVRVVYHALLGADGSWVQGPRRLFDRTPRNDTYLSIATDGTRFVVRMRGYSTIAVVEPDGRRRAVDLGDAYSGGVGFDGADFFITYTDVAGTLAWAPIDVATGAVGASHAMPAVPTYGPLTCLPVGGCAAWSDPWVWIPSARSDGVLLTLDVGFTFATVLDPLAVTLHLTDGTFRRVSGLGSVPTGASVLDVTMAPSGAPLGSTPSTAWRGRIVGQRAGMFVAVDPATGTVEDLVPAIRANDLAVLGDLLLEMPASTAGLLELGGSVADLVDSVSGDRITRLVPLGLMTEQPVDVLSDGVGYVVRATHGGFGGGWIARMSADGRVTARRDVTSEEAREPVAALGGRVARGRAGAIEWLGGDLLPTGERIAVDDGCTPVVATDGTYLWWSCGGLLRWMDEAGSTHVAATGGTPRSGPGYVHTTENEAVFADERIGRASSGTPGRFGFLQGLSVYRLFAEGSFVGVVQDDLPGGFEEVATRGNGWVRVRWPWPGFGDPLSYASGRVMLSGGMVRAAPSIDTPRISSPPLWARIACLDQDRCLLVLSEWVSDERRGFRLMARTITWRADGESCDDGADCGSGRCVLGVCLPDLAPGAVMDAGVLDSGPGGADAGTTLDAATALDANMAERDAGSAVDAPAPGLVRDADVADDAPDAADPRSVPTPGCACRAHTTHGPPIGTIGVALLLALCRGRRRRSRHADDLRGLPPARIGE